MSKKVAIICEYILFPQRIGGMDRFYKAYDIAIKKSGFEPVWFFKSAIPFEFYKEFDIKSAEGSNLESFFLDYCYSNNLYYDIVITHFLKPISYFFKEVKKRNKPYIINVDHNPRPLGGFPLKKIIKNRAKGLLYGKYVDKLVGVSNYTKEHILNDFGFQLKNKTISVYNGIDVSSCVKQELDRDENPINFIVVSHLRESKGIQDLLNAISKIDSGLYLNFKVDIYGDGPYKEELLRLQSENQLENVVNFKGNSPKINELLHKYHYLIQPTYMECFSLSILESLACNVPVITTTVGGNPEIIKDGINGYIFEPKDIGRLSEIIKNIITGEIAITNEVNIEIEKEFTLDKMVRKHIKLLTCI